MSTIYDVAKLAGVSPKTVSRVLNNDAPVVDKTRHKVEAAIAELGYVPSTAARSMRSNKTGLVGLITGAISQFNEPEAELTGLPDLYIVQGVQEVMQEAGKTLLIADIGDNSGGVKHLIRTFQEHRVEGLMYVARYHKRVDLPLQSLQVATVLANCFDDRGTDAIVPDDESGQQRLVEQVLQAGHRRIAYLTLDPTLVATKLRLAGYKRALAKAGVEFDPNIVLCADRLGTPDGHAQLQDAIAQLFALDEPPTVICCGNDKMALHLYGVLRVRGLKVPEDISIAGFDNYVAIAESLYPALTTVDLAYREMGREAAQMLLNKMKDSKGGDKSKSASLELDALEGAKQIQGPVVWRSSVSPLD